MAVMRSDNSTSVAAVWLFCCHQLFDDGAQQSERSDSYFLASGELRLPRIIMRGMFPDAKH
jgi:hypothetical protein